MHEYPSVFLIGAHLLVVCMLLSMMTYIWQFHKFPGAKPQFYAQACKCVWLLMLVFSVISQDLSDQFLWNQLRQMVCVLSPYFWWLFVIEISRQQGKVPLAIRYGQRFLIGGVIIGILSNAWHGLFWPDAWLEGHTLHVLIGPGVWVARLSSYLSCILAIWFSIRWIAATVGLRRRQALWFTLPGLFSVAGSVLDLLPGSQALGLALPLSFLINGLLITWGFYRWHIYNVLPLGQEVVVRELIDGIVVVDAYGYIAELNPAAKSILNDVPGKIGGTFSALTAAWPELLPLCDPAEAKNGEAIRDYPDGRRCYQLHMTPLQVQKQWLGQVIVFKDITEQKEKQAKLVEQQKALSILTERERLGRELHDGRAQTGNFLSLELQTVHTLLAAEQVDAAKQEVDRLLGTVRDLNTDIRESIVGLKDMPDGSEDFSAKLRDYLAWYEQNRGIRTQLILPTESIDNLLGGLGKLQLLRIIQEALTNIRKHAKAKQALVQITIKDRQLGVLIEDDGCGFDAAAVAGKDQRFGLRIMAERAQEAGGRFQIETKPGHGTKIMVCFTLQHEKKRGGKRCERY